MQVLQISSFFLLFPFVVALWQQNSVGAPRRYLHATTGALFVSSVVNHSRPHDGPVYDTFDIVDKAVVAVNVAAAGLDAVRDDVPTDTVLLCATLSLVVGVAYGVASDKRHETDMKPHVELLHAVCVHGVAAVILTALSL